MRVFVVALSLCLGWTLVGQQASSDQKQQAMEQAMANMKDLAAKLNLSEDQKKRLQPIMQEEAQKMAALRNDTSKDQRAKMQEMRKIRDDFDSKAKPILSSDQWKILEEHRQQTRQEMRQKAKGRSR